MAPRSDAARAAQAELARKRGEHASLVKQNQAMMDAAVAEGSVTSADFMDKYDEATKVSDTMAEDIQRLDLFTRQHLADTENGGVDPMAPFQPAGEAAPNARDSWAKRFRNSSAMQYLTDRGVTKTDSAEIGTSPAALLADRDEFRNTLLTTSGYPGREDRRDGIIPLPLAPLTLLDLITVSTTDQETVEWVFEKTFTNTAAETGEGTAAPEGVLEFDSRTALVKDIPFFLPATRRILRDPARLDSYINQRLGYGVRARLQNQVVGGNGAGQNLTGILNQLGILSQPRGTASLPDVVHFAMTAIRVASNGMYEPRVMLAHPYDEERLVLSKSTGTNEYLFGGPTKPAANTAWGMLVVPHVSVPEGNPIVCDPALAELAIREGLTLSMSDSHGTYFTERKVAFLAAISAAFGLIDPSGFCEITNFDS